MTDGATLSAAGKQLELSIVRGTEGERATTSPRCSRSPASPSTPASPTPRACTCAITYIDGDAASCATAATRSRSSPSTRRFIEVSYLLIYGELPTPAQLADFDEQIRHHTMLHEDLKRFFEGFPRDAHPMPVLSSAVSALSTFYQDSLDPFDQRAGRDLDDPPAREAADDRGLRLQEVDRPAVPVPRQQPLARRELPADDVRGPGRPTTRSTPTWSRRVDLLLILHADHEQNCSTSTVRLVGSSQANLFASVSAGINALFGPLHGGANQAVLEMLERIQGARRSRPRSS